MFASIRVRLGRGVACWSAIGSYRLLMVRPSVGAPTPPGAALALPRNSRTPDLTSRPRPRPIPLPERARAPLEAHWKRVRARSSSCPESRAGVWVGSPGRPDLSIAVERSPRRRPRSLLPPPGVEFRAPIGVACRRAWPGGRHVAGLCQPGGACSRRPAGRPRPPGRQPVAGVAPDAALDQWREPVGKTFECVLIERVQQSRGQVGHAATPRVSHGRPQRPQRSVPSSSGSRRGPSRQRQGAGRPGPGSMARRSAATERGLTLTSAAMAAFESPAACSSATRARRAASRVRCSGAIIGSRRNRERCRARAA